MMLLNNVIYGNRQPNALNNDIRLANHGHCSTLSNDYNQKSTAYNALNNYNWRANDLSTFEISEPPVTLSERLQLA